MEEKECRRKPFEQCSRRHQRRIIQKNIAKSYHYLLYRRQLNNNRLEDPSNTFHNNISNSSSAYVDDETEVVCIINNELLATNLEKDFDDNFQIYFEFEDESNYLTFQMTT